MGSAKILDTPLQIEAFSLLSIRGRLQLELKGIRFKNIPGHGSTFSFVRHTWGLKGNKQKVYEQFETMLKEKGILRD